jgi:hypothetical protein
MVSKNEEAALSDEHNGEVNMLADRADPFFCADEN